MADASDLRYADVLNTWARRHLDQAGVAYKTVRSVKTGTGGATGCPTCGDLDTWVEVTIEYVTADHRRHFREVEFQDHQFATFLGELIQAAQATAPA